MCALCAKARAVVLVAAFLFPSLATAAEPSSEPQLSNAPMAKLLAIGTSLRRTALDCSHLVQDLYRRVGLHYEYANSVAIFKGEVEEFKRVFEPQKGDLIVWKGHVGIVVDPEKRTFVSKLRSGVKVANYESRYWKRRGPIRFFRYAAADTQLANNGVTFEVRNGGVQ